MQIRDSHENATTSSDILSELSIRNQQHEQINISPHGRKLWAHGKLFDQVIQK